MSFVHVYVLEQVTQHSPVDVNGHENTSTDSRATESFRLARRHTIDGHQWSAPEQSTTEDKPRKWSIDSMLIRILLTNSHTSSQFMKTPEALLKQSKQPVAPRTSLNCLSSDPEDHECDILHDQLVSSLIRAAERAQIYFEDYVSILVLQPRLRQTFQTPSLLCVDCSLCDAHPWCIDHLLHILSIIHVATNYVDNSIC